MKKSYQNSPKLFTVTFTLFFLSLLADIISIKIGVAWGDGGYMTKINWSLFPIFFLILGVMVHFTWVLYIQAWLSSPKNEIIYKNNTISKNETDLTPFLKNMQSQRLYLIIISIFLGMLLTSVDAGALWCEYDLLPGSLVEKEEDFSVAFRLPSQFPNVEMNVNKWFNIYVYLLQGCLISYGWVILMQIMVHGIKFWKFESSNFAKKNNLKIKLNIKDPLCEFGLTEFNRALNSVYMAIAAGMIIPIISAINQPEDSPPDIGQWLLRILLPLVLLAPLLIPLTDRYFRLKEASNRVLEINDEDTYKAFKEQKLWPFEGTQIGYLGKVTAGIAGGAYIYLFSQNIKELIKAFKF